MLLQNLACLACACAVEEVLMAGVAYTSMAYVAKAVVSEMLVGLLPLVLTCLELPL